MKDTAINEGVLLESLPGALLSLDPEMRFNFANLAAEQLFDASWSQLRDTPLSSVIVPHGRLVELIEQVRDSGSSISEFGLKLHLQKGTSIEVDAHIAPAVDRSGSIVMVLQPASVARNFDQHRVNRGNSRSISAMARILAHEVKNPLSGIRGAAQLLEQDVPEEDRSLVRLICDEVDRICTLVERVEEFGEWMPIERKPVNIHEILEHVKRVAENGFARHIQIIERYDPSLPWVDGDRDKLIQLFLNLVKNAAEAAPGKGGRIMLQTRYQHGVRMSISHSNTKIELPITVEVCDNGPGVPADLADDIFEPFVTSKAKGGGLGLSLVTKIAQDHGGIVSFEPDEPGSIFRVRLAVSHNSWGTSDDAEANNFGELELAAGSVAR